ncbi:MAG: hypothetical protein BMS9Abin05_0145 [Rhodothermia bacterium]|nr:MAG: hypothetical protein BMS9Abin05_0145 [Rhodothermia bacterium]
MKLFFQRRFGYYALVGLLSVGVAACDSSSVVQDEDEADITAEIVASVSFIASDLQLDADETDVLESAFATHEDRAREPGFLWYVAAELQQRLSDEQIERLLNRLENRRNIFGRPGFDHGQGSGFANRFDGQRGFGDFGGAPSAGAFADHLGLTDDQKAAIAAMREHFRTGVKALREQHRNGMLSFEEFREELKALEERLKNAWHDLLTEDQRAILEQLREDRRNALEERREEMEARRAAAREVMIAVLGLSERQVSALEALHDKVEELRGAFQELIDSGATREEVMEWAQDATSAVTAELVAILDQTQLEIYVIHGALESRARHRFRHARRFDHPMG